MNLTRDMKKLLALIALFSILFGSCRKDTDIGPADLLYQRWHLDRVKRIGDTTWISYDTDGYYDTEYRLDGTLIHRKDGVIKPTSCCEAGRYSRKGVIIEYGYFVACPFSLCGAPPQSTTITVLRENQLELNDGQKIAQYNAVK